MVQGNSSKPVRSAPPSLEANNTDVFVWALYLLGGSQKQVDVEDIYLKTFEIAPARFGWRTRPDLPNFKKTAKALQEIEAKSHTGLLQSLGQNSRRLTKAGIDWIEAYKPILERNYGMNVHVAAPSNGDTARAIKFLKSNDIWESWVNGNQLTLSMVAVLLEVSKATPPAIWMDRFADLNALATASNDPLIAKFANEALSIYEGKN
jgi:hypothetical protein